MEITVRPATLGELKETDYRPVSVKIEMRRNLLERLRRREPLFPGIVGYDRTVIPALQNAILARHNFILLGLRGQAKSRILRSLSGFLDPEIPVVEGCHIRDNPFDPLCKRCRRLHAELGDKLPVAWLSRGDRFQEKLATPDVTVADLIGDLDPIKAATQKLIYSDEEVIHFGIVPRTNRGIFAINELPDLQPRIQVALLNLLEEGDIQVRGFPVRIPLDLLLVFTANPEDYTNRGNIITPLKDRIDSQILTHYPASIEDGIAITAQEAWVSRDGGREMELPRLVRELVEEIAFQARKSDLVYQQSGVSARLPISALENLVSNLEKRSCITGERQPYPRVVDLMATLPAITGKVELAYEGEQEGAVAVGRRLIGLAIKEVFGRRFPPAIKGRGLKTESSEEYREILRWFSGGRKVEMADDVPWDEYVRRLRAVTGLEDIAKRHLKPRTKEELALGMELVLEGLHQNSLLAKESAEGGASYFDMVKIMFDQLKEHGDF
ncbi:MAG: magnesium chelatase [Armatimonadetes bacterium]|nr:magnesium chelatase [Armatimonadota bacterium]